MLTAGEAFKIGFMSRCIEDRLSPEETRALAKQAEDRIAEMEKQAWIGDVIKTVGGLAGTAASGIGSVLANYAIPAAIVAPPVVGGLAGYGLAKARDVDDTDVDEIKDRELIDEYKRQAARLERQKTVRDYEASAKRTGRIFL